MLELKPNQILVQLSAAHLVECRQWQRQIEAQWWQTQRQASDLTAEPRLIPHRGGAIGGAFTYTIRFTVGGGYHLRVQDAISQAQRQWSAASAAPDSVVFAKLHEREYQLLRQWFTESEGEAFDRWVQTRLEYEFCDNTLGRITRVCDTSNGSQLDLTDYEGW